MYMKRAILRQKCFLYLTCFSMNSRDFSGEINVLYNWKKTTYSLFLFVLFVFVFNIFAFKTLLKALFKTCKMVGLKGTLIAWEC